MKKIALIGGGPAALFMFKRLVQSPLKNIEVSIFEQHEKLGAGMPYSKYGSSKEHITNVSDNEIPELKAPIKDWLSHAPTEMLSDYSISEKEFNEDKVLPRLLFGEYLSSQFDLFLAEARKNELPTNVFYNTRVRDIEDVQTKKQVKVSVESGETFIFDEVIICTGHSWPCKAEESITNWFDSPYPPQKLFKKANFPIAIKGASLTAIDAVRTLSRANGCFTKNSDDTYSFKLNPESVGFHITLHAIDGLLPAMRFHLEDNHLEPAHVLSDEEIYDIKQKNNGFVPLDSIYELNFKQVIQRKNPELFEEIKEMRIEDFISFMMEKRKKIDAFTLLKAEYKEAEKSIERYESVIWKETLSTLSYAINYPAKHFSAEDMIRLKEKVMPLISIIIAYMPQSSARELMALHEAGLIEVKDVDSSSSVVPGKSEGAIYKYSQGEEKYFSMFIDAVGQRPFFYNQIPFEGLKKKETISAAYLRFASNLRGEKEMESDTNVVLKEESGGYLLQLPGININDFFQPLDVYGVANPRLFIMAVPFIAGVNPDYSGLDFCEAASEKIIQKMMEK
ncbi:FAD/NAD(P)-binding protein [Owenweeksia hongkongensis]|uniref:FAD/NAD(P)-binding protein n=1 Tax=Owenweeksia hongkongensis TaxID=253245 RepID=UPI003A90654A